MNIIRQLKICNVDYIKSQIWIVHILHKMGCVMSGRQRQFNLGMTKAGKTNVGLDRKYIKPSKREDQPDIMHDHHGVIIDDKKQAVKILQRVPYDLLIYPGLKIWYSRSPNGIKFMQDTTIEELYELYKFDSFMKGKILEVVRSFENMFLGSLAYHFEYEYQEAAKKRELSQKRRVRKHNMGYSKLCEDKRKDKTFYKIIPLWDQFFSDNSNITINDEITIWRSLKRDRFLKRKKQKNFENVYNDRLNAIRFDTREINFMRQNAGFKSTTVRQQCIADIIRFSCVSNTLWKKDIGAKDFEYLLDTVRQFRNAAAHPGYILNKVTTWHGSIEKLPTKLKFTENRVQLNTFIKTFVYFLPKDLINSFTLAVRQELFSLNSKRKIGPKHLKRLEEIIGIKMMS